VDDRTQLVVAAILIALGLAWLITISIWRSYSLEQSARMFWLHLTAPLVAILFMLAGLALAVDRVREHKAAQEHGAVSDQP
jgi:hypothetical protein